jgi:hypothetical protein
MSKSVEAAGKTAKRLQHDVDEITIRFCCIEGKTW